MSLLAVQKQEIRELSRRIGSLEEDLRQAESALEDHEVTVESAIHAAKRITQVSGNKDIERFVVAHFGNKE